MDDDGRPSARWAGPGHRRRHGQRVRPPPVRRRAATSQHLDPGRRRPTPSATAVAFDRARSPSSTCTTSTTGPSASSSASSCARRSSDKERAGTARPLQFVVLDELNKYAPRDGSSPIKEILLDVAERGRSLGIILIGAQQTASEVERRIVANSAIRVVGRLDAAEAGRGEYGFLPRRAAPAGHDPQAGHDVRQPARAARCRWWSSSRSRPGPPGPARPAQPSATRPGRQRRRPIRSRGCPMKFLHTADWHVGKALRGRSRADEHRAVLAEIGGDRRDRAGRRRARRRRPVRHRGARRPRASRSSTRRCSRWRAPAPTSSSSPATTTTSAGSKRSRPCSSWDGSPSPRRSGGPTTAA